jgi:hypothetical protein
MDSGTIYAVWFKIEIVNISSRVPVCRQNKQGQISWASFSRTDFLIEISRVLCEVGTNFFILFGGALHSKGLLGNTCEYILCPKHRTRTRNAVVSRWRLKCSVSLASRTVCVITFLYVISCSFYQCRVRHCDQDKANGRCFKQLPWFGFLFLI